MNNSSPLKSFLAYLAVIGIIGYGVYSFASDTIFKNHDEDHIVVHVDTDHHEAVEVKIEYSDSNDPTFVESFNMSSGDLDVLTSGGGITVEGHDGNKVEVQAFVRKNGKVMAASDDVMKTLEDGFDMRIEKSGSTVYAHAKRKGNKMPWKRMSISFHVKAPHDIASKLRTSGGSIKISDLNGDQNLHTSGGSIHIDDIDGDVEAKTSGGSINIEDVDGELQAHTSGGSINIEGAVGNVEGRTSGGRIKLENVEGKRIDVRTSGGSIHIDGSAKFLKASTSGGSIEANVNGLSEELHLSTSGGSIRAKVPSDMGMDLDLKANRVNADLKNFSGTAKKDFVQGEMNGGGMPVVMRTSGGSINIDFQ